VAIQGSPATSRQRDGKSNLQQPVDPLAGLGAGQGGGEARALSMDLVEFEQAGLENARAFPEGRLRQVLPGYFGNGGPMPRWGRICPLAVAMW
jgi:hypothetical protein